MKTLNKYEFLIRQLVTRDFKAKYKKSFLGMVWSLLYPILIMAVQYVLFSTIFRGSVENYPVYLLCGSVLFTFFSDSVSAGLTSIVGNASLISKVYVPKYIYPVSKVFSSAINLVLSFIPLFLVTFITGGRISLSYVFIPFVWIYILVFCIGMSLILSALYVFFRDTQFLWGVASMLWMYATPMFYPEDIIPERFSFIKTFNPMYHYIRFLRNILMSNQIPGLFEFISCTATSMFVLCIGILIFNRTQRLFILYI